MLIRPLTALALSLTTGVLAGCGGAKTALPASPVTAEWTHTELLAHLSAQGVLYRHAGATAYPVPTVLLDSGDHSRVAISLEVNPQVAREKAGALPWGGFAWNRFVFQGLVGGDGAQPFLDQLRESLPPLKATR